METVVLRHGHLASQQLAAYIDYTLAHDERTRVEAHLAECTECRREVLEVTRVIRSRHRVGPYLAGALAMAAAVATLLLVNPRSGGEESVGAGPILRSSAEGVAAERGFRISVVSPQDGSELSREDLSFRWGSLGAEVLYRFTLTDQNGANAWTVDTPETFLTVPGAIELVPGRQYFWYVDALLPDGQTATTGVRQFTAAR